MVFVHCGRADKKTKDNLDLRSKFAGNNNGMITNGAASQQAMLQMCFRDWLGDFSFSVFVSKCNITNYHKSSSAIQMEFHLHINFWKAKAA